MVQELNPGLKVGGVLLTMFDARTNLAHQVVDEVRSFFGDQCLGRSYRATSLSEAPSSVFPLRCMRRKHRCGACRCSRGRGRRPWVGEELGRGLSALISTGDSVGDCV